MKVLLINGSPHEHGCTYMALSEVSSSLIKNGLETELVYLGTKPVGGCIACGVCAKTGKCIIDDAVNDIAARISEFDGLVVGSPVYYSSPSGQIYSFLDRLFYLCGDRMAGKAGAAVVSCRRGGASAAYDGLNKYFSISNMPIVSSNYWNQVHGSTPEQVIKDEEGMQTMRQLGENMAWLLKSIEAGRNAGIKLPEYEKKIKTNFIR